MLQKERGVSFAQIEAAIKAKLVLADRQHHNFTKYPWQFVFVVLVNGYTYVVPYVIQKDHVFLKTIFPSRKEYKRYLRGDYNERL